MLTLRPRFFELVCEFYKSRLCHKGNVDTGKLHARCKYLKSILPLYHFKMYLFRL